MITLLAVVIAGCGTTPGASQTPSPAASAAVSNAPSVPATTPAADEAATAESAAVAEASAAATAMPDLPTPAPTITAAPPASPFPLEAGWWDNAVCYEVFVRSFYDGDGDGIGDLNGLIEKLDYISDGDPATSSDLGATCIWLMPIAEAASYHGYDTIDYYNVERDYGTNDDFKRLIDEAHKRNIRVVIDLVLNHTSSEHPWFKDAAANPESPYRDWYLWSKDDPGYRGPWGDVAWHKSPARDEYFYGIFWSGMPDLNYRNPAVTAEAEKISAFWLNDMGVDGFRLDAIKHLIENGKVQENTPETHAWLQQYRAYLQQTKPGTFTIGEIFGANPRTLTSYYPDQLDSYFVFDVGQQLIGAAKSGAGIGFALTIQNAANTLPFQRFAPFLTNHDQNRVMVELGGDTGAMKIAATALLTLPGMPFVYYGEEIGMLGAKPDEKIRTPMQWSAEANGGFTTGSPWEALQPNYAEANVAAQADDPGSLLNLYRRLIQLHTSEAALGQGDLTVMKASLPAVVAYTRSTGDETVLVVLNFGKAPVDQATLTIDTSALQPGTYQLQPLLGDQPGADLTVEDGGRIAGLVPLPTLAPQTGYIFKLVQP